MIPSVVAHEVARALQDFLATGFGRSTIVATGTGSGKTECFLWPILDHCRRHAGEEGVKAILVHPMNALALDQARRIAKVIHDAPALRGKVSAGLYVGEREKAPHTTMGREHLVTGREALRYLVVDELHTFDGPQGTDLACLIRRLRERLQVPRQASARQAPAQRDLICVGTSPRWATSAAAPNCVSTRRTCSAKPSTSAPSCAKMRMFGLLFVCATRRLLEHAPRATGALHSKSPKGGDSIQWLDISPVSVFTSLQGSPKGSRNRAN